MAKITIVTDSCTRRTSPNCEGTFTYERKPGRPPVACKPCRNKLNVEDTPKVRPVEGECRCGKKFEIKSKGKVPERCTDCREEGTVWRQNESGEVERIPGAVRNAEISREEQERKDAAGHARAAALVERMKLLHKKTNREVIVH